MSKCLSKADFKLYDLGVMGDVAAAAVREHLDSCLSCRHAYDKLQGGGGHPIDALAQTEPIEDAPADPLGALTMTGSPSGPATKVAKHFPRIDGYKITGVLGQGGMGIVYSAVQSKLSRTVALKVLPAMVSTANPSTVSRFRREATAAARLHHTNIIPIYDYGQSRDGYYYAMEVIVGQPLNVLVQRFAEQDVSNATPVRFAEVLTSLDLPTVVSGGGDEVSSISHPETSVTMSMSGRGRVYYRQVALWMADTADALHYAHGQGIIHRDIKPSNLILSVDGRIMVADFGLAKTEDDQSVTMTGAFLGSLRYVSPEQAMAKRVRVDHRTDIYSLGATMYELLCFQPAFPGTDDKQVLGAIIAQDPVQPRKIHHTVPDELNTICLKCLEKSKESRYGDARAMADDLRRYINDLPIVAKPPGTVTRVIKFVKRRKAPVIAVMAFLLLTVAMLFSVRQMKARKIANIARTREEISKHREMAVSATIRENWDDAEAALREARQIAPDDRGVLATLAWMHLQHHKLDPEHAGDEALEAAVEASQRCVELYPTTAQAWSYLAVALRRLGRASEAVAPAERAVEEFKKTEELDAGEYASVCNLGVLYMMTGDFDRAENMLRSGTATAGVRHDPWRADAWRNLAAFELQRKRAEAVKDIEEAIRCNRFNATTFAIKARIHLELDGHIDPVKALKAAQIADNNAEEKNATVKRILALAYLRNDQFDEAVNQGRTALDKGDFPTINHLILAVAEAKRGNPIGAREHLAAAEVDWPEDLRNPGDFRPDPGQGELWIESADVMLALRDEARALLGKTAP